MNFVLAQHDSSGVQQLALVVMLVAFGLGLLFIWWSDRPDSGQSPE